MRASRHRLVLVDQMPRPLTRKHLPQQGALNPRQIMPERSKLNRSYDLPANLLMATFVSRVASGPDGRMCAVLASPVARAAVCAACLFLHSSIGIRTGGVPDSVPYRYRRYLQNGISSFFILQNLLEQGPNSASLAVGRQRGCTAGGIHRTVLGFLHCILRFPNFGIIPYFPY